MTMTNSRDYYYYYQDYPAPTNNSMMNSTDDYYYPDYPEPPAPPACDTLCAFITTFNILIFLLGSVGNGLVIWITGLKMRRTVTSSWYLSLAVSDFLFCSTLPLNIVYMATGSWTFGLAMCKVIQVAFPLNMYSSIFLLIIISLDRCVCVMFPVWSQNRRSVRKSSIIISLAWILAAFLSLPQLLFSILRAYEEETKCIVDYHDKPISHGNVVVVSFVFGFALPLVAIVVCYSIITVKLKSGRMRSSVKPFKVMTAVILTFVVCMLPLTVVQIIGLYQVRLSLFKILFQVAVTIAYANSFMNPILYSAMGEEFRSTCYKSILTRMESVFQEDTHSSKVSSNSKGASVSLECQDPGKPA